jgi:hypothetical protein
VTETTDRPAEPQPPDPLPRLEPLPPAPDPDKQALENAIRWMMAPIAGVLMCLAWGVFFASPMELLPLVVVVSCFILPLVGGAVHRSWKVVRAGYMVGAVVLAALWFSLFVWPTWFQR